MSLKPEEVPEVPVDTARIARAALALDNRCLAIRDRIGTVFRDGQFQSLFPAPSSAQLRYQSRDD